MRIRGPVRPGIDPMLRSFLEVEEQVATKDAEKRRVPKSSDDFDSNCVACVVQAADDVEHNDKKRAMQRLSVYMKYSYHRDLHHEVDCLISDENEDETRPMEAVLPPELCRFEESEYEQQNAEQ